MKIKNVTEYPLDVAATVKSDAETVWKACRALQTAAEDGSVNVWDEGRGSVGQGSGFSQTPALQIKSKTRRKHNKGEQLVWLDIKHFKRIEVQTKWVWLKVMKAQLLHSQINIY